MIADDPKQWTYVPPAATTAACRTCSDCGYVLIPHGAWVTCPACSNQGGRRAPDASTPPPVRPSPGYEHWVRATSNGDLDMEIDRLKRAGVIYRE